MDLSEEKSASVANNLLIDNFIYSFISFLSFQLNEFQQSEIKHELFPVQKIPYVVAIADMKIISVFCVFRVLHSQTQSAVQIK